jgi:hypothetical protein
VRTNYESTSPNKRFDTSPNHKRYDASPSTSKEYASKPLSESNIDKQTNSNHNTRDPREFSSKDQSTIVHVRRDSFSHSETNYFIPVSGTLQYHSENEQPPSLPPRDGDYTQKSNSLNYLSGMLRLINQPKTFSVYSLIHFTMKEKIQLILQ